MVFTKKTIGLVANFEKKEVRTLVPKLQNFCRKKGWKLEKVLAGKNLSKFAFLLALGGDGTILKTARFAGPKKIPILGINVGSLGFLAAAEAKDLYSVLEHISQGKYLVEERTMLTGEIYRQKKKINHFLALNDCVLRNPHSARVINLEVSVDNHLVSEYQGDGLILSTAVGSTAYNLAAGGPLVLPELPLFILTPICPHSLTLRPLIISQETEIKIRILSNGQEILLSIDGQEEHNLKIADEVLIRKAENNAHFLFPKDKEKYFPLLRKKFKWG